MRVFPLQAGFVNRHRIHKVIGVVEVEEAVKCKQGVAGLCT